MFYCEYREKGHGVDSSEIIEFDEILGAEAKISAMILDARFKVAAITRDSLESVNYYDNKFTGIAEVVSNDGSYSFFWKRLWVAAKNNGWILADDDCAQYCRNLGRFYQYELIQYEIVDPDRRMYCVRTEGIDILDYLQTQEKYQELSQILQSFGYEDLEEVKTEFPDCYLQIVAECIFESGGPDPDGSPLVGTEEKCREFIAKYIATAK